MTCALICRSLRWRLLLGLVLTATPTALIAASYAEQAGRAPTRWAGADGFIGYLDAAWFRLPGASAVFLPVAVLLGSLGSLVRPRSEVVYVLAFGVARRRWLWAHAAAAVAGVAALVAATALIYALAGWRLRAPQAAGRLGARSLAVLLAAASWCLATTGTPAVVRHPAAAVAAVLTPAVALPPTRFTLDLPAGAAARVLPPWDPWALADPRAWQSAAPLAAACASAAAIAVVGALLARRGYAGLEP